LIFLNQSIFTMLCVFDRKFSIYSPGILNKILLSLSLKGVDIGTLSSIFIVIPDELSFKYLRDTPRITSTVYHTPPA